MRFGVHIPTCIEGMMYPVPFAEPEDILPIAQLAERVGFDSVWGNDHMTTQRYVQREWPDAAELLRAAHHLHLRGRAHRAHPPGHGHHRAAHAHHARARQAGGHARSALGRPRDPRGGHRRLPRGVRGALPRRAGTPAAATSSTRACARCACSSPSAGPPSAGATCASRRSSAFPSRGRRRCRCTRAATTRRCAGAPASTARAGCRPCSRPRRSRAGSRTSIGRRPRPGATGAAIDIAPQFACSIGRTHEEAVQRFHASQLYKHLESLKASTLREQQAGGFEQRNLIGSPAEICERIRVYAAGRRHHVLRACSSSPTPCPRCRRRSSSSGARSFPNFP